MEDDGSGVCLDGGLEVGHALGDDLLAEARGELVADIREGNVVGWDDLFEANERPPLNAGPVVVGDDLADLTDLFERKGGAADFGEDALVGGGEGTAHASGGQGLLIFGPLGDQLGKISAFVDLFLNLLQAGKGGNANLSNRNLSAMLAVIFIANHFFADIDVGINQPSEKGTFFQDEIELRAAQATGAQHVTQ